MSLQVDTTAKRLMSNQGKAGTPIHLSQSSSTYGELDHISVTAQ